MPQARAYCPWCTAVVEVDFTVAGESRCAVCGDPVSATTLGADPTGASLPARRRWRSPARSLLHELPFPARVRRLHDWLVQQDVELPPAHERVLALCDSASEVRFALPVITLADWRVAGDRGFASERYSLSLQEPIGPYFADFVFRDTQDVRRRSVIEVDGPTHHAQAAQAHDADRSVYLANAGFTVARVPATEATERGLELRRSLVGERMQEAAAAPAGTAVTISASNRAWSRRLPLAYDVTGLPIPERRALVESWLASRGRHPDPRALDVLAHCNTATEVLFLLPLVSLEGALLSRNELRVGAVTITVGDVTSEFRRPVTIAWGEEDERIVIDIDPPPHQARDAEAARRRARAWQAERFAVDRVYANRAEDEGRRWAGWVTSATDAA